MLKNLILFCSRFSWFILGGNKPKKPVEKTIVRKRYSKRSRAEYQRHYANASSNMGLLGEAREAWYELPFEYRKKKQEEWKKRYGKDWKKHVVI